MQSDSFCIGLKVAMLIVLMLMLPGVAAAKKIYSPIVEQGELEFEYVLDMRFDNDPQVNHAARHQFELEYGVTDRWLTAVYGDFDKTPGQTFRYRGVKWENIYQLFGQGERWLDAGVYAEYIRQAASIGKADVIEFKLLLEKTTPAFRHTANLTLKKEVGARASGGLPAGYAWRSRWQWQRAIEPSIEYYASIGDLKHVRPVALQSHQMGPVLHGYIAGDFSYEFGYLFGLTPASDRGMLKLIVGYAL